jgi:hypothetical protein
MMAVVQWNVNRFINCLKKKEKKKEKERKMASLFLINKEREWMG